MAPGRKMAGPNAKVVGFLIGHLHRLYDVKTSGIPMARSNNLPAKKFKAGQRTETRLKYKFDAGNGGIFLIDIAKSLSQLNRRAYRQGLYYYVSKVGFSNGGVAYCSFNTALDNWVTKAAWVRGYRQWSKMNRKATSDLPGAIYPKYHDYKVSLTGAAALSTSLDVAYGELSSSSTYSSDEWVQSDFVTEDPVDADPRNVDSFVSHVVGPHTGSANAWTSIGLIASLNDSWPRQANLGEPELDPDADTDPLANLFDDGDNFDDVRLNLDTDNDEPPYNHDMMPGAVANTELACRSILRTGGGGASWAFGPGFVVPFGLMHVVITDFAESGDIDEVEVTLDVVPGSYHGVYAERCI